jgi:hypothetical protein
MQKLADAGPRQPHAQGQHGDDRRLRWLNAGSSVA